jgi:hypothetical protein
MTIDCFTSTCQRISCVEPCPRGPYRGESPARAYDRVTPKEPAKQHSRPEPGSKTDDTNRGWDKYLINTGRRINALLVGVPHLLQTEGGCAAVTSRRSGLLELVRH